MNHTPGPYHIEDASENLTYPIYKIVKTSDGLRSVIATCADMALCEEHGGTVANNARLIAAAPELLEALKNMNAILSNIQNTLTKYLMPDSTLDQDDCINAILAISDHKDTLSKQRLALQAIAKAEGKEA